MVSCYGSRIIYTHIIHNIRIYADPYVELSQNLESSCPNVYLAIVMLAPLKNKPLLNPGFGFFVRHDLGGQSMGIPRIPPKLLTQTIPVDTLYQHPKPINNDEARLKYGTHMYPPFHQRSSHFQPPKPGDFSSKHFIQCLAGETWEILHALMAARPGHPAGVAVAAAEVLPPHPPLVMPRLHHCPMQRWAPKMKLENWTSLASGLSVYPSLEPGKE